MRQCIIQGLIIAALTRTVTSFQIASQFGFLTTSDCCIQQSTTSTYGCQYKYHCTERYPRAYSQCMLAYIDATDKNEVAEDNYDDDEHDDDVEGHHLVGQQSLTNDDDKPLDNMEKAWRYATKPLLRIGSKGATLTHGNSLRQLLDSHTVVKVKINTRRFENSLNQAFLHLKQLAEDNGAPADMELLQARESEKTILVGLAGTRDRIRTGDFPPAPPKQKLEK